MRPIFVAIVGGSGSGKTWLAERLQAALGHQACRLSLDDFYRDRRHLSPARRARLNFDHPRAIDWPLLRRVLRRCLAGKRARLPRYDFATHCRESKSSILEPRPVVLVEGLWLFRPRELRRLFHFRIYIQCAARVRLQRRLKRDQSSRARTARSVRRQFRMTVQPMHARYIEPQARWADVILRQTWGHREISSLLSRIDALRLAAGHPRR